MNRKSLVVRQILCCAVLAIMLQACVSTTTGDRKIGGNADEGKAVLQYTELGLRYVQQGKTVEARRPLKRALEIDPKSTDVHHALAILFQAENDLELADQHFLKAIEYGPERTNFRNNYAVFLFGQKRYAEAAEQFEKSAEDTLYDKRSDVFSNLGVCYLQLDKRDAALESFERAISIDDTQARALLEAALIYFEKDNIGASANYHKQFQRLVRFRFTPSTPRSLGLGIELARLSGNKDREASYQLMLKNMYPNSAEHKRYKK